MRILITGGTGSFGQAMAKRILEDGDDVCIYSRGEHTQHAMQEEFKDYEHIRFFIGDVRDRDRLRRSLDGVDICLHAAALKRIEVGQYNPGEMVKTNILGAMNVIEACKDAGVAKCVMLSTDKAYQPVSPYGQSKAIAESLFLNAYQKGSGTAFAVTRYGNVWKSAGSVVPKWQSLYDQGVRGLPVTDPFATRFFMTMDQAVELVDTTMRLMDGGELVIPDWLPAYQLRDLAEAFPGCHAEVIGMESWEKKHEGMKDGCTSDKARRMTIRELRSHL